MVCAAVRAAAREHAMWRASSSAQPRRAGNRFATAMLEAGVLPLLMELLAAAPPPHEGDLDGDHDRLLSSVINLARTGACEPPRHGGGGCTAPLRLMRHRAVG